MSYLEFFQDGKKIDALEFPETEIGRSSQVALEIKNPNPWPVMLPDSFVEDPDITFSKMPESLEPVGSEGDSADVTATLKPTPGRPPVKAELNIKVMY